MLFLGVDIGGTKIAAGVIDKSGFIVSQASVHTPADAGGSEVLRTAIELSRHLIADTHCHVKAVGIGAGGQVNALSGMIESATELLPGWAGQAVGPEFSATFHVPAFVDNDVNAFAVGEQRFGAAKNARCAAFLALGTGVGGAIIVDGKLLHGAHWSGGELGHILIDPSDNARVDSGGHKGTLEAYASGHGLAATWREIGGSHDITTARQIAELAESDSSGLAAMAIEQTGRALGIGLVSVLSVLDPEIIVIGGGLASLGEALLVPAREVVRARALPGPATCPIVFASLGFTSSIIGAAAIAMAQI